VVLASVLRTSKSKDLEAGSVGRFGKKKVTRGKSTENTTKLLLSIQTYLVVEFNAIL